FSSRRRHTRFSRDWSSDVCSSDLAVPQLKRFTVSGLFQVGHQQFDRNLAVANMHDLQRVLRMGDGVTGVRLRLHDMDQAWQVARSEERRVGKEWRWLERRGAL